MKDDYKEIKKIARKIKKDKPLTIEEERKYRMYLRKICDEEQMFSPEENSEDYFKNVEFNLFKDREYFGFDEDDSMNNINKLYKKRQVSDKLNKYCEDLTAKKFKYNPAIGRNKELEELMIAILTPHKSAILTGQPGVGKTAIIEGLAYNIQHGNVPDALKNYTILQTSASVLNSNCTLNGMLEKRVLDLFSLLEKENNVVLFIDEIHTLIGTGSSFERSLDIANIIKPFLTSNNICLIGATTIDEYDEFISYDNAFQRRFIPIEIQEPEDNTLYEILVHTLDSYSNMYNIKVDEISKTEFAKILVKNTVKSKRNNYEYQYNPDLAISILATTFGYARLHNKKKLDISDLAMAYNNSQRVNGKLTYTSLNLKPKNNKNNIIKINFK